MIYDDGNLLYSMEFCKVLVDWFNGLELSNDYCDLLVVTNKSSLFIGLSHSCFKLEITKIYKTMKGYVYIYFDTD